MDLKLTWSWLNELRIIRGQISKEVKQFLSLSLYYLCFIKEFAPIAQLLTALTRNGMIFDWNDECQTALDRLKQGLNTAPVLCYPSFEKSPFILETDASIRGIGVILSQVQKDGHRHPWLMLANHWQLLRETTVLLNSRHKQLCGLSHISTPTGMVKRSQCILIIQRSKPY